MVKALFSPGNLTPCIPNHAIVDVVFQRMVDTYKRMFNANPPFCPAIPGSKKRVAFPERNLTFNFCNEYLRQAGTNNGNEIFVWQELDVVNSTRGHIDSVIIDTRMGVNTILFIEAKRIAAGNEKVKGLKVHKCEALHHDMQRLSQIILPDHPNGTLRISKEIFDIIKNYQLTAYKMALVDYWEWPNSRNNQEKICMENFVKCSGNKFVPINDSPIHNGTYYLNYCLKKL